MMNEEAEPIMYSANGVTSVRRLTLTHRRTDAATPPVDAATPAN